MREIKFRVWSPETEYSSGHMFPVNGYLWEGLGCREHDLADFSRGVVGCDYVLMQYTGLLDKNGTEIYEGDIVNFLGVVGEVVYRLPSCRFDMRIRRKYEDDPNDHTNEPFWDMERNGEVIGNIYENPELISEA